MSTPRIGVTRARARSENLADFYSSLVPMWIFDEKSLAILEVNEAAVRHFGYSRTEFLTLTMLEISPLDDIPKLLQSAFHSPSSRRYGGMWRHQKKDGTVFQSRIVSREIKFQEHNAELVSAEEVKQLSTWS